MTPSNSSAAGATRDLARRRILAAQVQLLYSNTNVAVGVTVIAAGILGVLQWRVAPHPLIVAWWVYMFLISCARFTLGLRYWRVASSSLNTNPWRAAFALGAGLAGAGWGAAGALLYPEMHLTDQVLLVFILGGMMLGAASILAPRPEAFLAFMVPTGVVPALRLLARGDEPHLAMGLLAALFTLATLITTWRIHLTIVSSLNLMFENQDLVQELRAAKSEAEALNEHLEIRVQERTAELHRSAEQLRAEIQQREQIEEELLRARKLESLGALAGGIAHDFNNFLTIVQGNIELARMQLDPAQPVQAILGQTESACLRAKFLSSQLLTFANGGVPVRQSVSVAQLVMDAVNLARAGTQNSIEVSLAENLRCAEVDRGQIGQALHNILLNARQAMPEGGIIEVLVENVPAGGASPADARVRISIRDYGCGIPKEILPRIFDPYFTTKPGKSGLGLATAYAIIAKHGGHLSVESKLGYGTLLTIDLPASQQTPAPDAPSVARVQIGTARILVMDDEDALRKLLKTALAGFGYDVQTARDGAEAIALCETAKSSSRRFDAVLLDLTVSSGMGGAEAAVRLKELDPSLKLIVSSGYSDAPVMADFRRYGFDEVIPKPWTLAEISEVFRRLLVPDPQRKAN